MHHKNPQLKNIGATLVAAAVLIAPWLMGGVLPEHQQWLFVMVGVGIVLWGVVLLAGIALPDRIPSLTVVLTLGVALGMLQLVPLPRPLVQTVSPRVVDLQQPRPTSGPESSTSAPMRGTADVALGEAQKSSDDSSPVESLTLSLVPGETRSAVALTVLAVAVFVLGAVWFRDPVWLQRLFIAALCNGAAIAFFGIVQKLTWNGQLFWRLPLTHGGEPFGPFVNRNNAAGYLCLCLAAGIGVLLARRSEFAASSHAASDHHKRTVSGLKARSVWLVSALVFVAAGIPVMGSRGGCVALAAGLLAALACGLALRRGRILCALGGLVVVGVGLALWLGAAETLRNRLRTLSVEFAAQHGRLANWNDAMKAIPDFLQCGSGLGTYRHVYGLYQERFDEQWYVHAENQYLEVLLTAGIPGLCLLVAAVGLFGLTILRLPAGGSKDCRAFAVAAAIALVTQSVAAVFDFGLSLPAGLLLLALLCGGLSGFACELPPAGFLHSLLTLPANRAVAGLLCLLLTVGCVFGVIETHGMAVGDAALAGATMDRDSDVKEIQATIDRLNGALQWRPDDWRAHRHLADLEILAARIKLNNRLRFATPKADTDATWNSTSPTALYENFYELTRQGKAEKIAKLRSEVYVREHLRPAFQHLEQALRACPLLADVHVQLAELAPIVELADSSESGEAHDRLEVWHLQQARQLAPGDERLWFRAGFLDIEAGRLEAAWSSFNHALSLHPLHLEAAVLLARTSLDWNEVSERVLPASAELLLELAALQPTKRLPDFSVEAVEMLCRRAITLLSEDSPIGQDQVLLARAYVLLGERLAAVQHFARAVELQPQNLSWRCQLIELLHEVHRDDEAIEQVRLCVQIAPNDERVQSLIRSLSQARLRP